MGSSLGIKRSKEIISKLHSESNIGKNKKYSINSKYFDYFNKNNSYVLGLLLTDGCMSKRKGRNYYSFSLGLKSNDKYIIEDICKDMNCTYRIYDRLRFKNEKVYNMSSIVVRDQNLCKRLNELCMVPRKSKILKCPKIPDEFISDFLRGVIDGDGSVSLPKKPRTSIVSVSLDFIGGLREMFDKLEVKTKIVISNNSKKKNINYSTIYEIRVSGVKENVKLFKILYKQDTSLYLKRKFNRFNDIYKKSLNIKV